MLKFSYSKVIGIQSANIDSIKCSPNDLFYSENDDLVNLSVPEDYDSYIDWSSNNKEDKFSTSDREINDDVENKMQNEEQIVDEYLNEMDQDYSKDFPTNKVKRSLELVEEHPPEGTYRSSSSNDDEALTTHSFSDMSSVPSIPSIPPMPSIPPIPSVPPMSSVPPIPQPPINPQPLTTPQNGQENTNTMMPNDITTTATDVEILETTTEDYGDVGEPQCNYDAFTYVLKCSLNLITSLFGLSDSCCKPLF